MFICVLFPFQYTVFNIESFKIFIEKTSSLGSFKHHPTWTVFQSSLNTFTLNPFYFIYSLYGTHLDYFVKHPLLELFIWSDRTSK